MDTAKYLERIDVTQRIKADYKSLAHLQIQHMLTVPFENLDVINEIPILLEIRLLYDKVVKEQRGGFCYELNGLFNWLLTQLGFSAYFVGATLKRENGWGRNESHATQIVSLDQPYLLDVGFGNSARKPLPLNGQPVEDVSGKYRVLPMETGYFYKQRYEDGEWKTIFRFLNIERKLEDFNKICHFVQTSPKSHFEPFPDNRTPFRVLYSLFLKFAR